jgi:hypothetical protein
VLSGSQSHARFDGLARDLRRTLTRHLDRVFAEAFPRLPKDDRSRMLAACACITGAMIANLDRSMPGERGKLLEELKTVLAAYLDDSTYARAWGRLYVDPASAARHDRSEICDVRLDNRR